MESISKQDLLNFYVSNFYLFNSNNDDDSLRFNINNDASVSLDEPEMSNHILEFYINNIVFFYNLDTIKEELIKRGYIEYRSVNQMKNMILDLKSSNNYDSTDDRIMNILKDIYGTSSIIKYIDYEKIIKIVNEYMKRTLVK